MCRLNSLLGLSLFVFASHAMAGEPQVPVSARDEPTSVYQHRVHPTVREPKVDWAARIDTLLKEEPGDVVITAVGDMIFNEPISQLEAPERRQLIRLMQEADIAYGNMEFSINSKPELLRPFYNFGVPRDFAWEVARVGINLVSLANNHTLDFGPEGLAEHLHILDHSGIVTRALA